MDHEPHAIQQLTPERRVRMGQERVLRLEHTGTARVGRTELVQAPYLEHCMATGRAGRMEQGQYLERRTATAVEHLLASLNLLPRVLAGVRHSLEQHETQVLRDTRMVAPVEHQIHQLSGELLVER